jgi:hypothetical protein
MNTNEYEIKLQHVWILALQMKACHCGMFKKSYIPFWFIFEQNIQNLFN